MSSPPLTSFQIGWICALPIEFAAAKEMLDEKFGILEEQDSADTNIYTLGRIGRHNIVIANLPGGQYGTTSATTVAIHMMRTFSRTLRIGLMVGIGGGIPSPNHDIRLGDIVVSHPEGACGGVLQYDMGKVVHDAKLHRTGSLNSPPQSLLKAVTLMQAALSTDDPSYPDYINKATQRTARTQQSFGRPNASTDRLFKIEHNHPTTAVMCETCLPEWEENRDAREEPYPKVFYGIIASGNTVIKHGVTRERLRRETAALCFEMEAAGLMMDFPCLVVRGICDYADSHKNKQWQGYAALAAASYAKELLSYVPVAQVSQERLVAEILSDLQKDVVETSKKADAIIYHQQIHEQTLKRNAILDWLATVDYTLRQNDLIHQYQPGTGNWLLNTAEFGNWLDTSSMTLFCYGIPGAGKTFLTAIVINHLQMFFQHSPTVGIAFIYCDFKLQEEQRAKNMLANILKQLSHSQCRVPEMLESLYSKHQKYKSEPSFEEISNCLHALIEKWGYTKIFILIDALDEYQAHDGFQHKLLLELRHLQEKCGVNIFLTSRPLLLPVPVPEFNAIFCGYLSLEVRAIRADITSYVQSRISHLGSFVQFDQHLQSEIISGIADSVDGMFLLAKIFLDLLKDKITENEVRYTLKMIRGKSTAFVDNKDQLLADVYDETMKRISTYPRGLKDLAIRILSWIACAKRPLTTLELRHALAVKDGKLELDLRDIPPAAKIVSVCAGLVIVDQQRDIIRLVHQTAQNYLDERRQKWFPMAETDIARTCLLYMSFEGEFSGHYSPFHNYAALHWGSHARESSTLSSDILRFLSCAENVQRSCEVSMAGMYPWTKGSDRSVPSNINGLHLAAYLGLDEAVRVLINETEHDPIDSYGRPPLFYAAMQGHAGVAQRLLDSDIVDANSQDNMGQSPLFWSAKNGHQAIVEMLLTREDAVDVNLCDHNCQSPLIIAVEEGHLAIASLLLGTNRADVDIVDEYGGTALSYAAKYGYDEVVTLLLNQTGDTIDAKDDDGLTPLSWAALGGYEVIVDCLLQTCQVDVNSRDIYGQTPLILATIEGHSAVVKLLLEVDAIHVDAEDDKGRSALSYADDEVVEGLIYTAHNNHIDT